MPELPKYDQGFRSNAAADCSEDQDSTCEVVTTFRLKAYPTCIPSGIEWLGSIPAHWGMVRAKALFVRNSRVAREGDEVVTCFRDGLVTLRRLRRTSGFTESLKEIGYQGIRRGDLVIHTMDAFAGAIGVADSDGKGTPVYAVCSPRNTLAIPHYYALCLRTMARKGWILALAKGIRERSTDFRFSVFATQWVPLPPLGEQAAITRFVNRLEGRLRKLVEAKEKLLRLLEELKATIISEAVTGKIDVSTGQPYPSYKHSGVEWIGKVPTHWDISRVKAEFDCLNHRRIPLSSVSRGRMTKRDFDYYGASGVIDRVDGYLFDDELLLIAEDGANLVLRNSPLAVIARGRFWVNNHAHVLKPRRGYLDFLADVMEGLDYQPWVSGAAQPKLTQERLLNIVIAVPPLEEQRRIIAYKTDSTGELDKAIVRIGREIELLKEYCERLIADVVTGKVDVRDTVASLPSVASLDAEGEFAVPPTKNHRAWWKNRNLSSGGSEA